MLINLLRFDVIYVFSKMNTKCMNYNLNISAPYCILKICWPLNDKQGWNHPNDLGAVWAKSLHSQKSPEPNSSSVMSLCVSRYWKALVHVKAGEKNQYRTPSCLMPYCLQTPFLILRGFAFKDTLFWMGHSQQLQTLAYYAKSKHQ